MSKLGWVIVIGVFVIALLSGGFMMGFGGGYGSWGMMGGPGMMMGGYGFPLMGGLAMLVFWALVIGGVIWVVQTATRKSVQTDASTAGAELPLEILKRRYAAGEITQKQFDEMKHNLTA